MPFAATCMDLEIIILSKSDKDKYIWYCLYVETKKCDTNELTKQKQIHRIRKRTYGYQRGKVTERDKLGVWDWHIHTTIIKIDNQQGPLVYHGELCSIFGNSLNEKRIQKRRIYTCICITESLSCIPETNITLLIKYTPI